MKKILLMFCILGSNGLSAQVGIGTLQPQASLHIQTSFSKNSGSIFKVTNSFNNDIIEYSKDGNLGINMIPDSNYISISSSDSKTPTLKFTQLAIFNDYVTNDLPFSLGISNSGQINKQTSVAKNYYFVKKEVDSDFFNSSKIIHDQSFTLTLPPGQYEIQAQIIYEAGSTHDIEIGLISNKPLSNSFFYGLGHYASYAFTPDPITSPYYLKSLTNTTNTLVFGGAGSNHKLVATLVGFVNITEETQINLLYKQQSQSVLEAKVYKGSNIYAKKI